jgi:hypothetical protein
MSTQCCQYRECPCTIERYNPTSFEGSSMLNRERDHGALGSGWDYGQASDLDYGQNLKNVGLVVHNKP